MTLTEQAQAVENFEDLVEFISCLSQDAAREDWENTTSADYLEAMAAWMQDTAEQYSNNLSWSWIASALLAAKHYE